MKMSFIFFITTKFSLKSLCIHIPTSGYKFVSVIKTYCSLECAFGWTFLVGNADLINVIYCTHILNWWSPSGSCAFIFAEERNQTNDLLHGVRRSVQRNLSHNPPRLSFSHCCENCGLVTNTACMYSCIISDVPIYYVGKQVK